MRAALLVLQPLFEQGGGVLDIGLVGMCGGDSMAGLRLGRNRLIGGHALQQIWVDRPLTEKVPHQQATVGQAVLCRLHDMPSVRAVRICSQSAKQAHFLAGELF